MLVAPPLHVLTMPDRFTSFVHARFARPVLMAVVLAAPLGAGALPAPEADGAAAAVAGHATPVAVARLLDDLRVGDVVFIRVTARPFREVADATGSWTNHVGVVVDVPGRGLQVAESTVPFARLTPVADFVARSDHGRVAVRRLGAPLTPAQAAAGGAAAARRLGTRYDTGFDLHSGGQFCSRFVREVLAEATGETVGEVQTFAALLRARPDAPLGFWQAWFFGRIPWQRETVTPASQLHSPRLATVFDGHAAP